MKPHLSASRPSAEALAALRGRLRGTLMAPDEVGYEQARMVWNAMIDRHPALIVRARGTADVMAAVRFAREHRLAIAVRGGGHNVAGLAVCDGGLMIDLSAMTSVQVDPQRRRARVEPGALLADLDRETQARGLVVPAGFISSTGVAGLTLGGGFGYLSRRWGLTADNLREVELVTAEGEARRVTPDGDPELFWGLCGGGGNFGVVTALVFALHDLPHEVLAGPVVHDIAEAPAVLRRVAEIMRDAPDDVACLPVLRHAPPKPFIPESHHGAMILLLAMIHSGEPGRSEQALAPLRGIGRPLGDAVARRPYVAFQSMFDATAAAGARNYWKGHYLDDLADDGIDTLCEQAVRMPGSESSIGMLSLGGEIARRDAASTPYPHRRAGWVVNIQARWRDPEEDPRQTAWAREAFAALAPFATGGAYVNFLSGDEGEARLRAAYGEATHDRLRALKRRWDPDNVFHLNQNIPPADAVA
ncbi:FAD-binding oxidoreductase [Halomonas organivorans]|uniref:FAD/FMN-containing dehydrogenase n=1 Tax=Halomonas organivorans TaxID=257772 RepID=A0A7W5G7N3_9GAMM|nr:FAD-binding oxidoreductase [Halomonas organivorans]MBB3142701.1 FAD/FMN-containing dehydrogenase [Halomonas organivorans]